MALKTNWLRDWWSEKWGVPWRHNPQFEAYTEGELLLEYMCWLLKEHPDKAAAIGRGEDVQFVTGDAVVDKIEADLAKGGEWPDLISTFLDPDGAAEAQAWLDALDERDRFFREEAQRQQDQLKEAAEAMLDENVHPLTSG